MSPCPFCGGTDINPDMIIIDDLTTHFYFCMDCYADGPLGESEAEAAEKWNGRFSK